MEKIEESNKEDLQGKLYMKMSLKVKEKNVKYGLIFSYCHRQLVLF
ncbi:MAG: hypothetical protein ACRC7N_09690 [Clostridium sp.]